MSTVGEPITLVTISFKYGLMLWSPNSSEFSIKRLTWGISLFSAQRLRSPLSKKSDATIPENYRGLLYLLLLKTMPKDSKQYVDKIGRGLSCLL